MHALQAEHPDLVLIQRPAKFDAELRWRPAPYAPDWQVLLLKTFETRSMVRVMRAEPECWYFPLVGRYFDVKAVDKRGIWVHPQFTETPLRPLRFEDVDL